MSVDKITEAMDTVEISKAVYDELVRDQAFLQCLEAAGVDNWEWYGEAVDAFQEEYPDDED